MSVKSAFADGFLFGYPFSALWAFPGAGLQAFSFLSLFHVPSEYFLVALSVEAHENNKDDRP